MPSTPSSSTNPLWLHREPDRRSRFQKLDPAEVSPWLAIHRDVARDLYWHALVHEYAHGRLRQMRDRLKSAREQGK